MYKFTDSIQLSSILLPRPAASGVLTQVTAAGGAVGADLQPAHDVLQVSAVAAALTPHKQPLHHVVAHGTDAGALVTPAETDCVYYGTHESLTQ